MESPPRFTQIEQDDLMASVFGGRRPVVGYQQNTGFQQDAAFLGNEHAEQHDKHFEEDEEEPDNDCNHSDDEYLPLATHLVGSNGSTSTLSSLAPSISDENIDTNIPQTFAPPESAAKKRSLQLPGVKRAGLSKEPTRSSSTRSRSLVQVPKRLLG